MNLASSVFRHAEIAPGATALFVGERRYTYAEFARAAGRVAAWSSQTHPKQRGPRVGILAARTFEAYAGLVGALCAGGCYVALNPKHPAARLRSIINQAELDALVVDEGGAARLKELAAEPLPPLLAADSSKIATAGLQTTFWAALSDFDPLPPVEVPESATAYILFTSGTTGVPKGVIVSVANVEHFLGACRTLYPIGPADRAAQQFELSFDPSVMEMFCCWDGGAALHVIPEAKLMAPAGFILEHELTVFATVPSLVQMMRRMKYTAAGAFPSLRLTFFGGEPAPIELLQAWQSAAPNSEIHNMYGPTEVTVGCTSQRLTSPPPQTTGRATLAIGLPFPGMKAAVIGPDGAFLGPGEIGELALSGPQVTLGYLGDTELTKRRFPTLLHPELGATRWYLSGDSAYFDADGRFYCLGRMDHQVKILGHRVELEDIELHLRTVCATKWAAAVPWPVVNGRAVGLVAFVSEGRLEPDAIRAELRKLLPPYMVPGRILTPPTLPLSENGKLDRGALVRLLESTSPGELP